MENKLPKSNKKLVVAMISYILCPIAMLVLFQNCGSKNHSTASATFSSLDTGDLITPEPEPEDPEKVYDRRVEANQMVANRILTANYFKSIFGPDIETTVATLIAYQAQDFGSAFSIYDRVITPTADCNKTKNIYTPCNAVGMSLEALPNVGTNIRREAFRIRSCNTAVKYRILNAVQKIDSKATSAKPPEINDANLTKAFHLFYRGRPAPTEDVLDALTIASQKQTKPIDKWKDVILSICLSPHWQVL